MRWQIVEWGWRLLPGGLAALSVSTVLGAGILAPFEQISYQALFQLRGELSWDQRLMVVAIDDATLKQLGQFPLSRDRYAQLLSQLSVGQPSVVVFNLLWSEASPADNELQRAIAEMGQVVLATAIDSTGAPLLPVAPLRDAAVATGHIVEQKDADGIVRQVVPQVQNYPALGIAALQVYGLVQQPIDLPDLNHRLWLNWVGSGQTLQQVSFADVISGRVAPKVFKDKIVLVGVTATGVDPKTTPFDVNSSASSIHLHATLIDNVLHHRLLKPLADAVQLWVLILGGPLLSGLISNWSTRRQVMAVSGLSMSWGILGLLLLRLANYWLPVAWPIMLFSLTGIAIALTERLRENLLLARQIERLWQTHQTDLVIPDRLLTALNNPQSASAYSPLRRVAQLAALAEQFGRSQSAQAAIARCLSIGLLATDMDGRVWFCNPFANQLLGVQVGSNLTRCLVPEWFSSEDWNLYLFRLRSHQPLPAQEIEHHQRWYELRFEPLNYYRTRLASSPPLDGFLLVVEDITPRKQIEANLNQQIEELNQISLLKDDFLSTVSHELRAPMTNMKMAIHMLQHSTEADRELYLRILKEECAREADLIEDLLDLQRLEAGVKPLRTDPLSLQDWLPHVMEPFYSRAENRNQHLNIRVDEALPILYSDARSLSRLITELVNNACKYTPPDHKIDVIAVASDSAVEIQVSNSGVEITADELPKIFDKFYRIPSSDRWHQGGTGLGLALVKRLTEHLGGSIHVTSSANQTTFWVQIPTQIPDADASS